MTIINENSTDAELQAFMEQRKTLNKKAEDQKRIAELTEIISLAQIELKELSGIKEVSHALLSKGRKARQDKLAYITLMKEAFKWMEVNAIRFDAGKIQIGVTITLVQSKFNVRDCDIRREITRLNNELLRTY